MHLQKRFHGEHEKDVRPRNIECLSVYMYVWCMYACVHVAIQDSKMFNKGIFKIFFYLKTQPQHMYVHTYAQVYSHGCLYVAVCLIATNMQNTRDVNSYSSLDYNTTSAMSIRRREMKSTFKRFSFGNNFLWLFKLIPLNLAYKQGI